VTIVFGYGVIEALFICGVFLRFALNAQVRQNNCKGTQSLFLHLCMIIVV